MGLSLVCAAQYFHDWEYKPHLPARAAELSHLARHWLLDEEPAAAQVVERVIVDRFLRALPRTHCQAFGMRNPTTVAEVEAVELVDAGERASPFPRRVVQEQRAPEGTLRPVVRPPAPAPRDKPGSEVSLVHSRIFAPVRKPRLPFRSLACTETHDAYWPRE